MTEHQKQRIDHYIQIYLNGIQSIGNDAGFESYSILARLIDFRGQIPRGTGNDQSNLGMVLAMDKMRERHAKWPLINAAVSNLRRTKEPEILALLARHFLNGECAATGKPYTDENRAHQIGQGFDQYRYNLKKSYQSFWEELEAAERYREYFGLAC